MTIGQYYIYGNTDSFTVSIPSRSLPGDPFIIFECKNWFEACRFAILQDNYDKYHENQQ